MTTKILKFILIMQDDAWLEGNPGKLKWCFAAGASSDWPPGEKAFPGFCYVGNGNGKEGVSAYYMELYTYIPKF